MTNYYNMLGLEPDADVKEIKASYRKLSKKFHPDLNPNDKFFHKMFLQIQEAYEVLIDEKSRAKYDEILNNYYQTSVIKEPNSGAPVIDNFSVDKDEIKPNEVFTITWKVSNADFVQIRPLGMFPTEGFDSFKFNKLKGESVNLIIIATNSVTGLSARKHLVLTNKNWKPSFFENNKKMDTIILVLKVLILTLIIGFILLVLIFGIEKVDPLQEVRP